MGLKTKSDIQFTRNVLESLGEWERAARMARAMIDRYSARSDSQDVVNAYREILISAMDEGGAPGEERAAEYNKLFAGYLTVSDRASAAKVLLALVELWRAGDSTAALAAAEKCIDLFRDNVDPNIVTQVHEAFASRFGLTEEDDPDFVPECVEYGNWLAQASLEGWQATSMLNEIGQCIPHKVWMEIAAGFLSTRRESLSKKDLQTVQLQIMWRHEELEEFSAALDIGLEMLKAGFAGQKERAETLLTLGTCFKGTKENETAEMFLRQVIRMYREDNDDWVLKGAREPLDEIEANKTDVKDQADSP